MTQWDDEYELIVLGAGVGGMTAALVASIEGLRTLLIEKSDQVGGTTAYSSGTVWIPDNAQQRQLGVTNDAATALEYLDALVGNRASRELRKAFIAAGGEMLDYLAQHTDVGFRVYPQQPDYRQDLPGATLGGRPHVGERFRSRPLAYFGAKVLRWDDGDPPRGGTSVAHR